MNFYQKVRRELSYHGVAELDTQRLFALLLGAQATPETCGKLASFEYQQLANLRPEEIAQETGINLSASERVIAAITLVIRLLSQPMKPAPSLMNPGRVMEIMKPEMAHLQQEHFVCLYLNTKNRLIGKKTLFVGCLDATVVHVREVFGEAMKRGAYSVVCVHNHPSGDPSPSKEDIEVTRLLYMTGEIMGIPLLDHVIICQDSFYSMKKAGYLDEEGKKDDA
ncbi:JAB domain-containing protein [Brevibacillus dissolubilis]|uniref:JAB domain-containing protein n=1 Tax=Brevibacillus dissolubilis TaxID=1844116 RepID=UPI001115AE6A|nr:DNA repair protein RadC [Brevibacillus dissolubilis]